MHAKVYCGAGAFLCIQSLKNGQRLCSSVSIKATKGWTSAFLIINPIPRQLPVIKISSLIVFRQNDISRNCSTAKLLSATFLPSEILSLKLFKIVYSVRKELEVNTLMSLYVQKRGGRKGEEMIRHNSNQASCLPKL